MITYRVCRIVNCPKKVLFDTLRDNQVELNEKLPNIRESKIESRTELDNGTINLVSELFGTSNVPIFLKKAVNEEKIRWYVSQNWNYEDSKCDFKVEAYYFKENVDINGTWFFKEISDTKTELQVHNRIKIDAKGVNGVPPAMSGMVSKFVEQMLYNMARPSLLRICTNVEELIREKQAALSVCR